jgi:FkbM family methyltransferase
MTLPVTERLIMALIPPALFYWRKIAVEAAWGEHELDLLDELLAPGGTAVDVGANQGFFAFAFSRIADRVEAFEPNPDYARFARRMLRGRARVHEVALSNACGTADFFIPVSNKKVVMHLAGNLKAPSPQHPDALRLKVEMRTLDSYAFRDVRIVKVDVEGCETEVLEGARQTILRDRPVLIVELLSGTHADPIACVERICESYGYAAWIVHGRAKMEAVPLMRSLGSNSTWGSPILNRNVLFLPRSQSQKTSPIEDPR